MFGEFKSDGEVAIERFIAEQRSEELFIDYKKSADDGSGTKLHHTDRVHLAKAISGFGNSEGGIVVWGVTCQHDPVVGDVPTGIAPLGNPKRFVSWLEGAVSGCTLPPHVGVRHHAIEQASGGNGFVVTYIPQSPRAPHQCVIEPHRFRYYLRAGSNFDHVPHGLLAGLFGQRPTPKLFNMWGVGGSMTAAHSVPPGSNRPLAIPHIWLEILIVNDGMVMARDLFVNIAMGGPGKNCRWALRHPGPRWQVAQSVQGLHAVAEDGVKLAPSACVAAMSVFLYLIPPFTKDLWYSLTYGCSGAPVQPFERTVSRQIVEDAYNSFLRGDRSQPEGVLLAGSVLGISDYHDVKDSDE